MVNNKIIKVKIKMKRVDNKIIKKKSCYDALDQPVSPLPSPQELHKSRTLSILSLPVILKLNDWPCHLTTPTYSPLVTHS